MVKVSRSITISTTTTDLFDYVAVPMNFLVVLPGLIKVYDVSKSPALKGDAYRWVFKILGVSLQGYMQITEYQRPKLYIAQSSGMGTSIWIYEIKSLARKKTELTLTIEYDYPTLIMKQFAAPVFRKTVEKEAEQMLHNLKYVLEGGA